MDKYWLSISVTKLKPVLGGKDYPGEVELLQHSNTSVYFGEKKIHRGGFVFLSSHRLLWVAADGAVGIALPLCYIRKVEPRAGFIGFSSPRITIYVEKLAGLPPSTPDYMYISFKESDRDTFMIAVHSALTQRAWVVKTEVKEEFSTSKAGIGGVLRDRAQAQRENDKTLGTAFADMNTLMANARDIVALAEKYAQSAEGGEQYDNLLSDMGIPNPVTRKSAGTQYHVQLAQQLCAFMQEKLEKAGGTMTLTAAYCVFNRARGTELISPEDMTLACGLFQQLGLPITLTSYPSGFMVLSNTSEAAAIAKVVQAVEAAESGLTAAQLSQTLSVSLLLATQYLSTAEHQELLCRDEVLEGVAFFPNFFAKWKASS